MGFLPIACSVCFGGSDSALTRGVWAGVFVLLGFIAFVLGGIAWTAFVWSRRAKKLEQA
ncbi:MAG TPA: hypothetical protein VL404_00450 [Candidatus Eisenbacteria bacterium]|nr:hypothetical protein [Candidatus Eisenbacteria bacterium]